MYAYVGAISIPLVLLPISVVVTLGGHSLMYIVVFGTAIGVISSTIYYDIKKEYDFNAMSARTAFSIVLLPTVIYIVGITTEAMNINRGWLLVPLITPISVASLSGIIMKERHKNTNNDKSI